MNAENEKALQAIRHSVRDLKRVALARLGPRFLHSTGQAYKGGPNSGVFLQITCDGRIRSRGAGPEIYFRVVKAAQARGDFAVLAERGRRAFACSPRKKSEVRFECARKSRDAGLVVEFSLRRDFFLQSDSGEQTECTGMIGLGVWVPIWCGGFRKNATLVSCMTAARKA